MQLANDNTLGTIDDKFTTTKHDWDVTQEDFFFDGLFFFQPQPNTERLTVSHPQLATLFRCITGLAQFVPNVA